MKKFILSALKKIRRILTFWVAKYDVNHLNTIRNQEVKLAATIIKSVHAFELCEIGGGAGWQAKYLKSQGFSVRSFDIETSNYLHFQAEFVEKYDGKKLPIEDATVDLVFSSNTLEHIRSLPAVLADHRRILKPNGYALHILPSSSWRAWTIITDLIKKFHLTKPHGELSDNVFGEIMDFSRSAWVKRFNKENFEVVNIYPGRLFYTGNAILSKRISMKTRKNLSYIFGSACHYFLIKKL